MAPATSATSRACLVLLALCVASHAVSVSAVCCKRKGDFGCCGNGPCNIFCCNCDNGCNQQCENTSCDTATWIKCAGVVGACLPKCGSKEAITSAGCLDCMKGLYNQCKQCYASSSFGRRLQAADSVSQVQDTRELFFMDVARGKDHITLIDFELWLEKAKKAGEKTGTTGNMTTEAAFKKIDINGDGKLHRNEFDGDHHSVKLTDIKN